MRPSGIHRQHNFFSKKPCRQQILIFFFISKSYTKPRVKEGKKFAEVIKTNCKRVHLRSSKLQTYINHTRYQIRTEINS